MGLSFCPISSRSLARLVSIHQRIEHCLLDFCPYCYHAFDLGDRDDVWKHLVVIEANSWGTCGSRHHFREISGTSSTATRTTSQLRANLLDRSLVSCQMAINSSSIVLISSGLLLVSDSQIQCHTDLRPYLLGCLVIRSDDLEATHWIGVQCLSYWALADFLSCVLICSLDNAPIGATKRNFYLPGWCF
ncbi:hypothetical protein BO99DRAFT_116568 [Aspergillus violaceofuscus CBS 115571]|uniref:Uncharacterized protein n=1 Tax=Aspergillus violaceofuscus (strain CBS 115571) TaxID=1450538 RepID=A0A2V5HUU9_ASPV1|nr:hypothetical protein BO99DRAFT_116568 [Aspergillus violaceofuscus CBS 115571]